MEMTIVLAAVAAAAVAVTVFVAVRARRDARRAAEELRLRDERLAAAECALHDMTAERDGEKAERIKAQTECDMLRSRQAETDKLQETMKAQFKSLAADVLSEQSAQFRQTNRDSLDVLLKPFKDNIRDFRERVEKIYADENRRQGSLETELKNLRELNDRITTETTNLTRALKGDSKVQGDWGELMLETLLERTGLVKGKHYDTQYNIKDEEGANFRPDVVLHMPEGKDIVIDSKVSLTAFVDYVSAEDDAARERYMRAHIDSMRRHVNELHDKEYHALLKDSPDFVIMFIPNEPAFLEALRRDDKLWSEAYNKKVIISSPANIFALLKMVLDIWHRYDLNVNREAIIKDASRLYDKLTSFVEALERVGTGLDKARASYDDAYKLLCCGKGNIISIGEKMRSRGLATKRRQSARALSLAEDLEEDTEPGIELSDEETQE